MHSRTRLRSAQLRRGKLLLTCMALACRAAAQSEAPGEGWSPRLVSRQRLLVFSEALICLSAPAYAGTQVTARPPRRSSNERRRANRLMGFGLTSRPRRCRSCFQDKCSQLISACLPEMVRVVPQACAGAGHLRPPRSESRSAELLTLHPANGCQTWTRTRTSGLTGRRATLTPSGNGSPVEPCGENWRCRDPALRDHLHRSV